MKKYILFIILIIAIGSMSCYDGLLETQNTDYKLRDIGPAGGLIFYVNPDYEKDGWRYLEAAPYDQSPAAWGCEGAPLGANGTSIGNGSQNTNIIMAGCGTVGTAAEICANLNIGGFSDWFLPSRDELELMCWNLRGKRHSSHPEYVTIDNPDVPNATGVGLGGFVVLSQYWSSSEVNSVDSTILYFSDGFNIPAGKSNSGYHIRAIRAF